MKIKRLILTVLFISAVALFPFGSSAGPPMFGMDLTSSPLSLLPDTTAIYDIGSEALYWRKGYFGASISFEGATDNDFQTTITFTDPTTPDKTITFPNLTGTVGLSTNHLAFFAATTSAQLAGVLSDETGGTGVAVFGTSPTITTDLTVQGLTGAVSTINIIADAAEDNSDSWKIEVADGGDMTIESYTSGAWVAKATLSNAGLLTVSDLATATTIGSAYIYRVGGTDVADGDVVDDLTVTSTKAITGTTLNLTANSNQIIFDSDEGSGFTGTLTWTPATSAKVLTLQNITGTIYSTGGTDVAVADGGTNCSAASITCFNNITGFTASGTTGTTSTNLVFSTSPAITTGTFVTSFTATDAAGPQLLDEAATATNPTLIPNRAEPDTGFGWAAADTPTVVVGGAEVMRWDAVGNVGIGVTPEAWQAAYTVLQIGGTSALMVTTTAQAGAQVELMQNAYYDGAWKYIVADEASDYHQIGGEHIFRYAAAGGAPDAALTWSTALTIENDGNALFGKTIEVDPTPASDHTSSGIIATLTLGETVTFGQSVYQKSDGKLWLTDADAAATMPCVGLMVESTGAADESKQVLFHGFIRDDTWDWTVGGLIYIDVAAGTLTQTAPSGAGDQVQVVGFAYSADIIFFNPNYVLVEI